jgi:hypothetical protein
MNNQRPTPGNKSRKATLFTMGLLLFVLLGISWIKPAEASIFEIKGIEIQMPLPVPKNQSPRNIGLARAENKAFTMLFNRMLTRVNQDFNRDLLETLRREKKRFIERSIVRSERRRLRNFYITVDVTFSKKEVSEAFARAGIAHGQTEYPNSLLIVKANSKKSHDSFRKYVVNGAKEYGLSLKLPLGDMDDMMQLNWENAVRADPALHNWAKSRYGLDQVWAVLINLEREAGRGSKFQYYKATANLLETTAQGNYTPIQSYKEGSFASFKQAEETLFPAVVEQLLGQTNDRWISNNSVEPVLRHTIPIRIVHNFNHLKYDKFLKALQHVPGFSGFKYHSMTAREAVIHVDYQGRDSTLLSAITRLGVQIHPSPVGIVVYIL